jgi:hypothetical protein
MDYVETHKIASPEQEGFRANRSCSRAKAHLSLCIENAHTYGKDILITHLDFAKALLLADHTQLARTLRFLGIPEDYIFIVTNLYREAHTTFQTPHGYTCLNRVFIDTLQRDILSLSLFLLIVKPFILWLKSQNNGYTLTSNHLTLSNIWYADVADVAYMGTGLDTQVDTVNTFSE